MNISSSILSLLFDDSQSSFLETPVSGDLIKPIDQEQNFTQHLLSDKPSSKINFHAPSQGSMPSSTPSISSVSAMNPLKPNIQEEGDLIAENPVKPASHRSLKKMDAISPKPPIDDDDMPQDDFLSYKNSDISEIGRILAGLNLVGESKSLSLLKGDNSSMTGAELPIFVSKDPFLSKAIATDTKEFMNEKRSIKEHLSLLKVPDHVAKDIENLGFDLNTKISLNTLFKAMGVDPHRAGSEIDRMKEQFLGKNSLDEKKPNDKLVSESTARSQSSKQKISPQENGEKPSIIETKKEGKQKSDPAFNTLKEEKIKQQAMSTSSRKSDSLKKSLSPKELSSDQTLMPSFKNAPAGEKIAAKMSYQNDLNPSSQTQKIKVISDREFKNTGKQNFISNGFQKEEDSNFFSKDIGQKNFDFDPSKNILNQSTKTENFFDQMPLKDHIDFASLSQKFSSLDLENTKNSNQLAKSITLEQEDQNTAPSFNDKPLAHFFDKHQISTKNPLHLKQKSASNETKQTKSSLIIPANNKEDFKTVESSLLQQRSFEKEDSNRDIKKDGMNVMNQTQETQNALPKENLLYEKMLIHKPNNVSKIDLEKNGIKSSLSIQMVGSDIRLKFASDEEKIKDDFAKDINALENVLNQQDIKLSHVEMSHLGDQNPQKENFNQSFGEKNREFFDQKNGTQEDVFKNMPHQASSAAQRLTERSTEVVNSSSVSSQIAILI